MDTRSQTLAGKDPLFLAYEMIRIEFLVEQIMVGMNMLRFMSL
jgi:hypothetical protein